MIPFNKPNMTGKELFYIAQAHASGHLAGDGVFTRKCHLWLEKNIGCRKALLTHSCTAALEMTAMLIDIKAGDEIIMPSYTFVSTANAFVLRGGVPVFIDIRPDTLNIDENKIEAAITPKTKAIVCVHYAGVGCAMDTILALAQKHNLIVIEDAAQGIIASYKNKPLGSFGHLAAMSFHETKNIISGEGGALLINDPQFIERAEILREKGTNRSKFFRGEIDKYTWTDIGSSFLPGEIVSAFLWAQLEEAKEITNQRLKFWNMYHQAFAGLEQKGLVRRPIIPDDCQHNAHLYHLLMPNLASRDRLLTELKKRGVHAVFHYVPLHSSPAGKKFGRTHGTMQETDACSDRLIRLPLWVGIDLPDGETLIETIHESILSSTDAVDQNN